MTNLILNIHAK